MLHDCDYFRILCFATSRTMARSGEAAHVVLMNLTSGAEKAFPRSSVDRIMGQLSQQIRLNLRRGDLFCQCTVSQFAILLPRTSYEDTQRICDRILKAFHRNDTVDLLLIAVHPDYQKKGVNAIILSKAMKGCHKLGIKQAETGPMLELNDKVQSQWKDFQTEQHKRRRCFIKQL